MITATDICVLKDELTSILVQRHITSKPVMIYKTSSEILHLRW